MTCVFDCETIPDVELIRQTFDIEGDDLEVTNKALELYEEEKGNSFLPIAYHQIVAISGIIFEEGKFKKISSIEGKDEKEKIKKFLDFINVANPRLISFNGRSFDLPMLMVRAMKYNLSCPAYFSEEGGSKDKWNNYRSRYSEKFHLDLMDVLGNFGAMRSLNLDTLSKMLHLPGKIETDGSRVWQLYYDNKMEEIKEYCEGDVLNTFFIFLKYLILKGELKVEEYHKILLDMLEKEPFKTQESKNYVEPFKEFIKREIYGNGY
ncbi:MAG: 3'-5' exonuclease [Epsilonproteobacteria bacterium]|nr:3'-5' exonuclease [Campylobacterota bacterium]